MENWQVVHRETSAYTMLPGCGQEYILEKFGEGINLVKTHCKKSQRNNKNKIK